MIKDGDHPQDLGPYLNQDTADDGYEDIRSHLQTCEFCRKELKLWQSMQDLFRAPEFEMKVPPFQWTRIAAALKSQDPAPGLSARFLTFIRAHKLLTSSALTIFLAVTGIFSGIGYQNHLANQQLLAIADYSEVESLRLDSAENPFRMSPDLTSDQNPFRQAAFLK